MEHVDVSALRKTSQAEILEEDQDKEKEVKNMLEMEEIMSAIVDRMSNKAVEETLKFNDIELGGSNESQLEKLFYNVAIRKMADMILNDIDEHK